MRKPVVILGRKRFLKQDKEEILRGTKQQRKPIIICMILDSAL